MNKADAIREYVEAAIARAIRETDTDSEGYYLSSRVEKEAEERAFSELKKLFSESN